jgi:hypothetical protein
MLPRCTGDARTNQMIFQRWKSSPRERSVVLEKIPKNARCAEIGVWKGDFSTQILATASPASLHLIDPWLFNPSFPKRWYGGAKASTQLDMDAIQGGVVRRFRSEPRVVVHRLASLDAATLFADATFDWIYVDGDHSYEAVKSDLTAWFAKLRVGGWLAGDDYDWRDEKGDLSVKRAVDEFISERGLAPVGVGNGQYIVPR